MTSAAVQLDSENQAQRFRPFARILLGLDLSQRSSQVARAAAYLAESLKADVIVAHVVRAQTSVAGNESDGSPANQEERNMLDSLHLLAHQVFGAAGDRIEVKILHGDPAQRLVEYAEYSTCDLLIVGSRGQGAFRSALLGSVSSSVVAQSKKPVLVLK